MDIFHEVYGKQIIFQYAYPGGRITGRWFWWGYEESGKIFGDPLLCIHGIIKFRFFRGEGTEQDKPGGMKTDKTSAPEIKVGGLCFPEPSSIENEKIRKNNFFLHKKRFSCE